MPESSVLPSHGSYLLPHVDHATVGDAMHPGILSCDKDATLIEVARMMSTHHVHCIVVRSTTHAQENASPSWGIISDIDVLRARVRPDASDAAADLAHGPVTTVQTTDPLRDAAELMLSQGTRHVVAVNPETGRAVGILSTLDIAGVLAWGEL
jgi:CBS domain-containing protein